MDEEGKENMPIVPEQQPKEGLPEKQKPLTAEQRDELEVQEAARIAREEKIRRLVAERPIMGGQGPGEEEARRRMPERGPIPEEVRIFGERIGIYPMEGRDLVELINEAEVGKDGDVGEIASVIRQALALKEGLVFGPEGENVYDLTDPAELVYLHNLFTTVESSTVRPNVFYLDAAIKEALGRRVREAERWHRDKEGWEKKLQRGLNKLRMRENQRLLSEEEIANEIEKERRVMENTYKAVPKLLELQNQVDARGVVDHAFIQRMGTCEDPGSAGNLLRADRRYQPPTTPDKGHWAAFFQGEKEGEFGYEVNRVFWETVKFGLDDRVIARLGLKPIPPEIRRNVPTSIYVYGFGSIPAFRDWLSRLLKSANNRMDIVWNAWKLACTWEITSELGIKTTKEGKYKVAIPPIGNALLTWTAHTEEQRAAEFGLTKDNKRVEGQIGKYVTHSGLPMSLGKFPPLCQSFLHESKPRLSREDLEKLPKDVLVNLRKRLPSPGNPDYKEYDRGERYNHRKLKQELEEVLRGEVDPETGKPKKLEISLWDLGLYGGLSFADKKFPWFLTEEPEPGVAPGELTAGSFGGWLLKRSRCFSIGPEGSTGVLKDIRSRPDVRDLADPDFFGKRVRVWDKVLGAVKNVPPNHEDYLPPEKNPRAWWVTGLIWYHTGGRSTKSPITEREPFREYRTVARPHEISRRGEAAEAREPTFGDMFRHALNCGFLRKEDVAWIQQKLKMSLA